MAFTATLRTRCGCMKRIEIPFPPNPQLIVPLKARPIGFSEQPESVGNQMIFETRTFDLIDYGGNPKDGYADYNDVAADVHGGLTFGELEPCAHEDGVGFWFGFDCRHSGDRAVPYDFEPQTDLQRRMLEYEDDGYHYWTLEEVMRETESLARQALEAVPHAS